MQTCHRKAAESTPSNSTSTTTQTHQQYIQLDTSNILFICGGTFVGVEEIVRQRLGKKTLGFGATGQHAAELTPQDLMPQVTSDDVLDFGMIPEFVGRLPVVSALAPLDDAGLIQVLTEPKNALVKQFQALFGMEDCELHFTEKALKAIANKALDKSVGARGLRGIVESVMLDVMFDLPEQPKGTVFTIDQDDSDGSVKSFKALPTEKKSA